MKLIVALICFVFTALSYAGISREEFHGLMDKMERTLATDLSAFPQMITFNRLWNNPKDSPIANRDNDRRWIEIYGGFARHPHVTSDSFVLVLCHELGHFVGGFPSPYGVHERHMTAEGQADYYATAKCLRKVFENDDNAAIVAARKVPGTLRKLCEVNYHDQQEAALCMRSGLASLDYGKFLAVRARVALPKVETPEETRVSETHHKYSTPQCRLDTFIQGALCRQPHNVRISALDETIGACHGRNGDTVGIRPACWFKAK